MTAMTTQPPSFDALRRKIEALKKSGSIDLSAEEDLSIAVMNLISLEEHFFFTGMKTENAEYFDFMNEVRSTRKALLEKLIDKHEGETWCITKHLLATTMRLMEVGTKRQSEGKKTEAKEIFGHAYKAYSLFWALRLKLIDASGFRQVAAEEKPWTLDDIVKRLVNCCDE
jgi:hypothetical protein